MSCPDTRTAPETWMWVLVNSAPKALQTAIDIKASGYHVFAAGENGLGKHTIISRLLHRIAADAPTPDDWVYVLQFYRSTHASGFAHVRRSNGAV